MQLINNLLPNIPIPEVFRQNMLGDSIPRFRKKTERSRKESTKPLSDEHALIHA